MKRDQQSHPDGSKTWTTSNYRILQVFPTNGASAVLLEEDEGEQVLMRTEDLHFLALVVETVKHWREAGRNCGVEDERTLSPAITGIWMEGGFQQIANECPCFAGIVMPGQDPWNCLCEADPDLIERAKKTMAEIDQR